MDGGWIGRDSALLAWLILIASITAYVAIYDYWAWKTGHRMMTTQFRLWLQQEVAGPIVVGLWMGSFIGLCWHFFVRARKP